MCSIRIRPADRSDAERLTAVYRNAYRVNRELGFPMQAASVSEAEVVEWIQEHWLFVAVLNGEIVGVVRLEETDPDRVKLSRLGVHERQRGNGIGRRLVEHVEGVANDRGYGTIWLTTPEEHPYLPAYYRQQGYEKTAPYPLEHRSYDEVIMEKTL